MDLEALEKSLKASFVSSANQLTQLYTNSLSFQKQAYIHGYNKSTRDMMEWILKQQATGTKTMSMDVFLQYLRSRLEGEENSQKPSQNESPRSTSSTSSPSPSPSSSTSSSSSFSSDSRHEINSHFDPMHGNRSSFAASTNSEIPFNFSFNPNNNSIPTASMPFQRAPSYHFVPPDNSSLINNSLGTQNPGFPLPNDSSKKRTAEPSITTLMDVSYPEQAIKKSKINVNT